MSNYKTEQEAFWAGEFGNEYLQRNRGPALVAGNLSLFSRILGSAGQVRSVLEFGPNIGMNLMALKQLLPAAEFSAVEINERAAQAVRELGGIKVYNQSVLEFEPDGERDFVLTKGILIHINPDALPQVYERMYRSSARYICVAEYYNPKPVEVNYRGHADRLFKRDFAGEILDAYPDLRLVDYGFSYHRDPNFPQDDINWFLLEKTGR
jgi:spore coat polysaccharide biosynthesis protein SpsF